MKKIAVAALALVAAGAAMAEVVSANTVGYMDIKDENAEEGFNVICPTFTSVGYNTVTLSDISLAGDDVVYRDDNLQIFDANGNAEYQYQWRANGWYDPEEKSYVNDEVIDRGTGFIVESSQGGISIRSVGEVCTNSLAVADCAEGFNVVGNPFPVAITFAEVSLTGDDVVYRDDNLQIFDANGNAEYQYQWRANGWYDPEEKSYVNDEVVPAGLGFIVESSQGGITVEVARPASLASL